VCHEFAGRAVNMHHIVQEADGGSNTLDNAIVLCLRCHSEAGHFNSRHPIGTKYSPNELHRHRDEWWKLCETHPPTQNHAHVEVSWKRTLMSQDLHTHRLLIHYHNSLESPVSGWKLNIYFPAKIPVRVQKLEKCKREILDRVIYNVFEARGDNQIYPGEDIELVGLGLAYAEYDMNHDLYEAATQWKFAWRFYSTVGQPISGEIPWNSMHEF
jgi:hypothetical protein